MILQIMVGLFLLTNKEAKAIESLMIVLFQSSTCTILLSIRFKQVLDLIFWCQSILETTIVFLSFLLSVNFTNCRLVDFLCWKVEGIHFLIFCFQFWIWKRPTILSLFLAQSFNSLWNLMKLSHFQSNLLFF